MDRRQIKTREAIFEAFASLLATKSYNKITVQEIIDKANVGRTTFYAHFAEKESLLQELCNDLFDHVFSTNPGIETTHDYSLSQGNSHKVVTHILYHLQDNKNSIRKIFLGESKDIFLLYFKNYLDQMIVKYILKGIESNNTDIPPSLLKSHISCTFINLIEWWITNQMKETPEALSEYFFSLIEPII